MRGLTSHFVYKDGVCNLMIEMELKSYAKINLALNVSAVRDDGYHDVETVMQSVSLCDRLSFKWAENKSGQLEIKVKTNKPYLPRDQRNLAYKGILFMAEKAAELRGKEPSGIMEIHIKKHIPVAAGLAGGSGNGAAALIAANKLWRLKLNNRQLCTIGEKMGADVPFCILAQNTHYKCAVGTGAGEKLQPLHKGLQKHVLLAKPAFGVSTKEVFAGIDQCDIRKRPDIKKLVHALNQGKAEGVYPQMVNVLECYTLQAYPQVYKLKELMGETGGVRKVLMSGSGPTVIGIYDTYREARKACLELRKEGYEAYWADTVFDPGRKR